MIFVGDRIFKSIRPRVNPILIEIPQPDTWQSFLVRRAKQATLSFESLHDDIIRQNKIFQEVTQSMEDSMPVSSFTKDYIFPVLNIVNSLFMIGWIVSWVHSRKRRHKQYKRVARSRAPPIEKPEEQIDLPNVEEIQMHQLHQCQSSIYPKL